MATRAVMFGLLVNTNEYRQQLSDGFKSMGFTPPVILHQWNTLPGHGDKGGRSDVLVEFDDKDIPALAIHPMHLNGGFSWHDDYVANNSDIIPEDALKIIVGDGPEITTFKKVKLNLMGLDGNAFSLIGAFRQRAKYEGWTKKEIEAVIEKCTSRDYNNLLCTLMEHCK